MTAPTLKRWSPTHRRRVQRPDGRYDWTKLAHVIAGYRRKGLTLRQIAARTGIPYNTIHVCNTKKRTLETVQESGLTRLVDLKDEVRVTVRNMAQRAEVLGIEVANLGRYRAINDADVPRLLAYYAERIDQHTARTWWSIDQAAQMLDLSPDALTLRIKHARPPFDRVRRARVQGATGNMWRYDPDSIRAVRTAQPVLSRKRPGGTLSSAELVELLNISRAAPKGWATQGAPHTRTLEGASGFLYFQPLALADWLARSKAPTRRSFARMLRAYVAEQQGRTA